jgi:hypothetical protein
MTADGPRHAPSGAHPGEAPAVGPDRTGPGAPGDRRVTDRRVLGLLSAVVVLVLAANVVSALVPGLDEALAGLPLVVVLLVVVTGAVLLRVLRGG